MACVMSNIIYFVDIYVLFLLMRLCFCTVSFTKDPSNKDAFLKNSPFLSCEVQDLSSTQTISWVKDSMVIADNVFEDDHFETRLLETSSGHLYTIAIKNVVLSDEGDYRCEVRDDASNRLIAYSKSARLFVLQTPDEKYPECVSPTTDSLIDSEIELTCISQKVNPAVKLTWWDQGMRIVNGIKTESKNDLVYSHYRFTATKKHNSKMFMCNQTSSIPKMNPVMCSFKPLDIYYKPEISIEHTNEIIAGTDSIIFCKEVSNPPVNKYIWTFSSQLNKSEYQSDGQVLRLLKVSIKRNGLKINCTAENKAGITTETTTLNVIKEDVDYFDDYQNNIQNSQNVYEFNEDTKDDDKVSLSVVIVVIIVIVVILVIVIIWLLYTSRWV
ncbi:cell adhesion molecule 3-like [Anneissia japonica]|uniref:cell adhesion molecule 3-like n=1 Tax=Anneissia japonica TaxID=1529436 RepID=UPI001425B140|nr:cell adhesion molecule 3-like [Anneissia japonica]